MPSRRATSDSRARDEEEAWTQPVTVTADIYHNNNNKCIIDQIREPVLLIAAINQK